MLIRVKIQWALDMKSYIRLLYDLSAMGMIIMMLPLSKGLHFCVGELESELKSNPKEEETHNEDELSETCYYYDGIYSATFVSCLKDEKRRKLAMY